MARPKGSKSKNGWNQKRGIWSRMGMTKEEYIQWLNQKFNVEKLKTSEIAKMAGTNTTIIRKHLIQFGLDELKPPMWTKFGKTEEEAAETIRRWYWDEQMSWKQIAEKVGCTHFTVQRLMKLYGIPRRSIEYCKEHVGIWRNDGRVHRKKELGYWIVKAPEGHPYADGKGYIREHRLIAEQKYGGPIPPEYDVHHNNGIKDDNRLENLSIVRKELHAKLEAYKRRKRKKSQDAATSHDSWSTHNSANQ